jgi:hypothetical protein
MRDFLVGDKYTAQVVGGGLNQLRKAEAPGAQDGQVAGLQDDPDHQTGDGGGRPGGVTQGAIADAFHQNTQKRGQDHGDDDGQCQHQPAGQGHSHGSSQGQQHRRDAEADIRPRHEDIAMGKIEQHHDAVHHGISQGDKGVKAAPLQGVDDVLQKKVHGSAPG